MYQYWTGSGAGTMYVVRSVRLFANLRGFDLFRDATNDDDQTTTTNGR